ncbi:Vacuolar protein-sorting-associated protein 27 [Geranomyces michiganensis]|nr:Vacuolar protein-sorting-associated protein 27 [Geranomyces michiganensis]
MSFLFANPLDELVDRATSENLPIGTDDLVLNLDIADKVKAKEVTPKQAVQSLKRRLNHKNPNVQILTLKLTDTCVKNSGHHFVQEVASREFVDNLVSIARAPIGTNPEVRQKILGFIQSWGLAFKSKADLRYLTDVYENLKREGVSFPPVERSEASAVMIDTTVAPEWTDSDVCMRCRTTFTTFNRKHHCRNCGQTFCGQCSSKQMPLSHLGIVQDVRVCDTCFSKLSSKSTPSSPPSTRRATESHSTKPSGDLSRREEDDLQKALALSLETSRPSGVARTEVRAPRAEAKRQPKVEDDDEDLKAAIAASLQDLNISDYSDEKPVAARPAYDYQPPTESAIYASNTSQSAYAAQSSYPAASASSRDTRPAVASSQSAFNPNELSAVELENIRLFSELVERTETDVIAHGLGALSNSQIQVLYAQIAQMQPKLSRSLAETAQKYGEFFELHEQLTSATREYDRLLQERLAAAGYGRTAYATPASGYQNPQLRYDTAAQYAQPAQPAAQAGGYATGYATGAAPPPSGAYYNSGPEAQPEGAHAPPPAQQYHDGQYAAQQIYAHGTQAYHEPANAHDPNAQTIGAYTENQPQGISNQYAPGPAPGQTGTYGSPEQVNQISSSEQRSTEAYYQPPPAGAPEHHYAPQLPAPQPESGNYVYQSQAPQQGGVGGQPPQAYGYAQPSQHQPYEQHAAPAPIAHIAPPPPESEAPLIEL